MPPPISLIQWLGPAEYKEAAEAVRAHGKEVDFCYREATTRDEARDSVRDWLKGNSNAQNCFIGTHGIVDGTEEVLGVGPTGQKGAFASWNELWQWFDSAPPLLGGLWLGACYSHAAASAFSELWRSSGQLLVPYVFGFSDSIDATEIEKVLMKLIEFSDINCEADLDSQLTILRSAVPGTKIQLFYPAADKHHCNRYVNVDEYENEVGISFSEQLDNNRSRHQKQSERP